MMHNLFGNNDYLGYKFPEPQYLGAKFIHRGWIAQFMPESAGTVLDAFGGSQSVAYMMKQLGNNGRSYLDTDTMRAMIEPYRNVKVEQKTYRDGEGGKMSDFAGENDDN